MLNIVIPKSTEKARLKVMNSLPQFRLGIKEGTFRAGSSIQKRVVNLLNSGARSGIKYKNLPNRSSAPGEVPRTQEGTLANSVYFSSGINSMRAGAKAKHAVYLSEGTKNSDGSWRISPRPHEDLPFFELGIELEERNTEIYLRDGVRKRLC